MGLKIIAGHLFGPFEVIGPIIDCWTFGIME